MCILLLISKMKTQRWPQKFPSKRADLQRKIESLRTPKEEQKKRSRENSKAYPRTEDVDTIAGHLPYTAQMAPNTDQSKPHTRRNPSYLHKQAPQSDADLTSVAIPLAHRDERRPIALYAESTGELR